MKQTNFGVRGLIAKPLAVSLSVFLAFLPFAVIPTTVVYATPLPTPAVVSISLPSTTVVGNVVNFAVTTTANDDVGTSTKLRLSFPGITSLEYQYGSSWISLPLPFMGTASALADGTKNFRATFSAPGTFTFSAEYDDASTSTLIASNSASITVHTYVPASMNISAVESPVWVGHTANFDIVTSANDDLGTSTQATLSLTLPGATGLEYKYGSSWISLPLPFTSTASTITDDTKNFRATFSAPGTFTLDVDYDYTTPATIATDTASIDVVAHTPPVITVLGANPLNLALNSIFTDPGATAVDALGSDISSNIVASGTVDTSVASTYTVNYDVVDSDGLAATTTTRTVNVVINTPPTITLTGGSSVSVEQGSAPTYTDPGYAASDVEDGDLTGSVSVSGTVDMNTIGHYTLTYSVTDSGSLTATTTRDVEVTAPVVTSTGGGGGGGGGGAPADPLFVATPISGPTTGGEVLGATITPEGETVGGEVLGAECNIFLTSYLRLGDTGADVYKLQFYLNFYENMNVAYTGVFDAQTFTAVKSFQSKYYNDIILPWVNAGYKAFAPTGFVYITTRNKINSMFCSGATPPLPELIPATN
jgi:hypothetical protein